MAEHTISMRDDGWRKASGARIRGPLVSRLVVSADGALKGAVLENRRASLASEAPAARTQSPALFGPAPTITSSIPGGVLVRVGRGRKGPYWHSYENAYVRAKITTCPFLPPLMIEFKPYALLTLGPEELEAVRSAVSRHFLAEELTVKISRFGIAVDLLRIGFVPPRESEILTRARLVDNMGDPRLASPTLGSPSGGVMFGIYDHTALRPPEEDWLSAVRRPSHAPPKGLRVWRTELTYHRAAIRELGLDGGGSKKASAIETVPALAGHVTDLLSSTLDTDDPWVRVVKDPAETMFLRATEEAPWWKPVREAFLEAGPDASAIPSMPSAAGEGSRRHRLGRLATLLSPGRR